jgi:hypothetical protein
MNGVDIILPGAGPSAKSYGLNNPNDLVQSTNNVDIVPPGTGPSNDTSGGAVDPYSVVISS